MRIDPDIKLDYDDVLIRPKRSTLSSRKDVLLQREFTFLHSPKTWKGVPIMTANMEASGTFSMAKAMSEHGIITTLHKFYTIDELIDFFSTFEKPQYVAYTLGIRDADFEKLETVIAKKLHNKFDFVCLDVPNAYLQRVVESLKKLRQLLPEHIIICGNVVTNEMTEELLLSGADIVKVGIGSGGACLTRIKAGVGYPQLSAVIETADAAHGISKKSCGLICADGGTTTPACIAKAFCAGADFVMVGSQLAGYDQSGGEIVKEGDKTFKMHYGSSSSAVMKKYYGKVANYKASEGRVTKVLYKGDVSQWVFDVLGSLRSTATYIGASRLKEFSKRATFLRVRNIINRAYEKFNVSD